MRKIVRIMLIMLLCITACTEAPQETVPQTEDPRVRITDLTLVVSNEDDLAVLDAYPNLKTLDLRGSTCYESIAAYIASHPHVSVTYDVRILEQRVLHNLRYTLLLFQFQKLLTIKAGFLPGRI